METPREQLTAIRPGLIGLHKTLVDSERVTYERVHGRVPSAGEFLQLVIHDSWFVWLRPISELIVRIDELLAAEADPTTGDAAAVADEARELLIPEEGGPGFATHYHEALQRDPAVVLAHAEATRVLTAPPR